MPELKVQPLPYKRFVTYTLILIISIFFSVFAQAQTLWFSYDDTGRLADVTTQDNKRIIYAYDGAGNLMTKTQGMVPDAPVLTMTVSGINLSLAWQPVADVFGYSLVYAPYPYTDAASIKTLDLGNVTKFSVDLWDGANFYVAVRSYNGLGNSNYSNVEYFKLSLAD